MIEENRDYQQLSKATGHDYQQLSEATGHVKPRQRL
jgi:hypothetical protein